MEKPANYLTLEDVIYKIEQGIENDDKKPLAGLVLAQLIDVATDYREEIRAEEKLVKAKKKIFEVIESAIMQSMADAGSEESPLMVAGGLQSTARISETEVPNIIDWDAFYTYIKDNDAFHLLQKRAAAKAWLEECKIEGEIPGTESFTQRKISLRKNK